MMITAKESRKHRFDYRTVTMYLSMILTAAILAALPILMYYDFTNQIRF